MEIASGVSMTTQHTESLGRFGSEEAGEKEGAMRKALARLLAEDHGQDLAEYGIALAVISILAGLAAVVISSDVATLWSQAQTVISTATSSATS